MGKLFKKPQAAQTRWEVKRGRFVLPSGNLMSASCHHRRGGACAGCYARMAVALDEIESHPEKALAIVRAVQSDMQAEYAAKKKRAAGVR